MKSASVVGLGKLGACMAASLASRDFAVVAVDISPPTVRLVNSGQPPVFEPGLADLMAQTRDRLRATSDYQEAVNNSEVTFVVVPTPSENHGGFSLKYVTPAMIEIGRAIKKKRGYHLVALTSTVLPGSCEHGVLPVLEEASGKSCGTGFGFCYSPEFIALGSVIRDFLNPDFLLVGEADARAGDHLASLYKLICENDPPVARMNLVNAELTKISVNSYVTMKITFANMLAALCERLPGGDVDAVTSALGCDRRIGARYLKGALGYGGPCFPRDNAALAYIARQLGVQAILAEATDEFNRRIVDRLVEQVVELVPPDGKAAVLGLSYKPDTNVVEESQGLQLALRLAARGVKVIVYDPVAMDSARAALGQRVRYADSMQQCLNQSDVVVVANPDKQFAEIQEKDLPAVSRPVIVDAWRLLRKDLEHNTRVEYKAVGLGGDTPHTASKLRELWGDPKSKQTV
jgi:UDPglucose 6-dehydrogenase